MSPSIAPKDSPKRIGNCSKPVPKEGMPMVGAIRFSRSPTSNAADGACDSSSKSLAVAQNSPAVLKGPTHVQGRAPAEERCAVVGNIGRQHQPEGNNQGIHSLFSNCFPRSLPYINLSDG